MRRTTRCRPRYRWPPFRWRCPRGHRHLDCSITATVEAGRRAHAVKRGFLGQNGPPSGACSQPRCSDQDARPFCPRSQYVSKVFQAELARIGAQGSMSRRGNCWDNGVLESFLSSLKRELLDGTPFESRAVARQAIFECTLVFYNRRRRYSTLGDLTGRAQNRPRLSLLLHLIEGTRAGHICTPILVDQRCHRACWLQGVTSPASHGSAQHTKMSGAERPGIRPGYPSYQACRL